MAGRLLLGPFPWTDDFFEWIIDKHAQTMRSFNTECARPTYFLSVLYSHVLQCYQ